MSGVTCQVSCVTGNFFYKAVQLGGGGSVIKWANHVLFFSVRYVGGGVYGG